MENLRLALRLVIKNSQTDPKAREIIDEIKSHSSQKKSEEKKRGD